MTELPRATWPLPWWVVALPGVLVVASAGIVMAGPADWAYVAPARVSSLPAEALLVVGPVASVAACWVMERFANRDSMLADAIAPRSSGQLGMRVVAVIAIWWGVAFLLICAAALGYWRLRATGGTFYPAELGLAVLRFEFFVLTGAMIGAVIARWHAALSAMLWAVLWVFVAPMAYAVLFPRVNAITNYFIFPALAGNNHGALGPVVIWIAVWWVGVIAALAVTGAGWFAAVARRSRVPLIAGVVTTGGLAVIGFALPVLKPDPFIEGEPPEIVCDEGPLPICVTAEQEVLLADMTPSVRQVLGRLGEHLPDRFAAVATDEARAAFVADGMPPEDVITISVGTSSGVDDPAFHIGASLAGLDACGDAILAGDDADPSWAFAFATWLSPDSVYARSDILLDFDDKTVLEWFSANESELRTCTYNGSGPG